jgi:glyoxylase-like metal-dependent hydrolase (beta-lactamase superfamily II)
VLLTRIELHLLRVGRCRHPEWVTLRGGRWSAIDFPALAALLIHPSAGPILYDTGYAESFRSATDPFPERFYRWLTPIHLAEEERLGTQLARFGVTLGDVRKVLISHFHADHVAGLRDLPGAGFLALRGDVQACLGRRGWSGLRHGYLPALLPPDFPRRLVLVDERPAVDLGPAWAPFTAGFDLLGDRSLLGIPLPGHSPAQLGVLLRTTDDRTVLLAADSCWSARAWREGRMPSIVARPLFADWGNYRRTLLGLRELAGRQPELEIIPSHCAETLANFDPHPLAPSPTRTHTHAGEGEP